MNVTPISSVWLPPRCLKWLSRWLHRAYSTASNIDVYRRGMASSLSLKQAYRPRYVPVSDKQANAIPKQRMRESQSRPRHPPCRNKRQEQVDSSMFQVAEKDKEVRKAFVVGGGPSFTQPFVLEELSAEETVAFEELVDVEKGERMREEEIREGR